MFFSKNPSSHSECETQQCEDNQMATAASVISSDLTVEGNIKSTGDVQVEGQVIGDIRARRLVIGEGASVRGNLFGDEAIVQGHVVGDISASKVELGEKGHVEGKITHHMLSIKMGAHFEGDCLVKQAPTSTSGGLDPMSVKT